MSSIERPPAGPSTSTTAGEPVDGLSDGAPSSDSTNAAESDAGQRAADSDGQLVASSSAPAEVSASARRDTPGHRWLILVMASSLTTLLLGVGAGRWWHAAQITDRLEDPEFLQRRLAAVTASEQPTGPTAPAVVRVAPLRRRDVIPRKPLLGRLVEYRKVTLSAEVEGTISELPVEAGTAVTGAQTVLAQIDGIWSELALQQSEAQVAAIQVNLELQQNESRRLQQLADVSTVTASELESQASLVEKLEADLRRAQSEVAEKKERVARCRMLAPFDGTVIRKLAEVGQTVKAGTPIVEIVSRGTIDAEIRVPERQIAWIEPGMELELTVQPLAVQRTAEVVSVIPFGPTASRTFPVRLRMDDMDGRLMVGMSVQVEVPLGEQRRELVVDKSAVLQQPTGSTLWIADPAAADEYHAREVSIEVLTRDGDMYAVRPATATDAALLTGARLVIIEGAERLMADQPIRIVEVDPQLLEGLPKASGHDLRE